VTTKHSLGTLLAKKRLISARLENILGESRAKAVSRDFHARRKPRPCGLTIHSVWGCTGRCVYCYIPDMGVSFNEARPYALSPEEISYAVVLNKYFLPGRWGTYLAVGSIGEPFHPLGAKRTVEYIAAFFRYLGNPVQFSTKMLTPVVAKQLARFKGKPLSPLITIVKLHDWRRLEPGVMPPDVRFEAIKALRQVGLYPILFLRPLIPGINTDEVDEILRRAKESGAVAVVIGGFRVTPDILLRLEKAGLDTSEIRRRIPVKHLRKGVQVPVRMRDIKEEVASLAREHGLVPLYSACCAATLASYLSTGVRASCAGLCFIKGFCAKCPVKCWEVKIEVDEEDLIRQLRGAGISARDVNVEEYKIIVKTDKPRRAINKLRRSPLRVLIETSFRRRLEVG